MIPALKKRLCEEVLRPGLAAGGFWLTIPPSPDPALERPARLHPPELPERVLDPLLDHVVDVLRLQLQLGEHVVNPEGPFVLHEVRDPFLPRVFHESPFLLIRREDRLLAGEPGALS